MIASSPSARVYRVCRIAVFAVTLIALVYLSSRYSFVEVPTDGLDPELLLGERVVVDEWGAEPSRLEIGQFVIYDAIVDESRAALVGVVAAVPGGELPSGYRDPNRDPDTLVHAGERVPESHAIILNGGNSRSKWPDSRRFGPVDVRAIKGRIIGRLPF